MNIFTEAHETEWKEASVNSLLVSLCWIGGAAVIMSLFRAVEAGIQLSHYVQLAVYTMLLTTTLNKHRISIKVKASTIIIGSTLVSFVGIYNWGLYSASFFWILFTPLLVTLFFNYKAALWFVGMSVLFILYCMVLYNTGELTLPIDADEYQTMYSAWGTVIFGDVFMMVMLIIILSNMKEHIVQLLANLELKQQEISHLADHEELTGLPVYRLFKQKLEDMLTFQPRENRNIAVIFMDLDGFKAINDNYGHDAGDTVLKEVAARIRNCIRQQDMLVRMGGDEFVALCSTTSQTELDIDTVSSRIIEATALPIHYKDDDLFVGISIGIALNYDANEESVESLIQQADHAMYKVKKNGKNNFAFA